MATLERTALQWDYAPAPESRDAASLQESYDLFIDGARHVAGAGEGDLGERFLVGRVDRLLARAVGRRRERAADEEVVAGLQRRGVAGLGGGRVVPPQRGPRAVGRDRAHRHSFEKSSERP